MTPLGPAPPPPPAQPTRDERRALLEERLATVRDGIARAGGRAALFRSRRAFAWLTVGGEAHVVLETEHAAVALLVTPDRCVAIAPVNEAPRIREEEVGELPIEVVAVPWHEPDAVERSARAEAGGRPLEEPRLEPALATERMRLAVPEHARLRWLGTVAAGAFDSALRDVTTGMREDELAARAVSALAEHGVRAPVLLVAADDRIARYRHPLPTERPIARRVMVVIVAERWGLHVAGTRSWASDAEPRAGTPASWRDREAACTDILARMREASRPGATLGEVLAVARAAYAELGFPDEWRLHHQGGTIGYAGRERIAIPGDTMPLRAGMAVAWNPSITGAKAESTDLVGPDGPVRILA